ncbi:MAG TPA: pitrilysin family protein [Bryobacteraceae bacterium]|nr:pitrilysin family protein [Bryobacteraceae bacterium]
MKLIAFLALLAAPLFAQQPPPAPPQFTPRTVAPLGTQQSTPPKPATPAPAAPRPAAPRTGQAAPAAPDYKLNIPHEEYTLANGLRVVFSRDNAVPVVALAILYDGGTRAEDKAHFGYAHLLEHLMEAAPANAAKGEITKFVRSNGGQIDGGARPGYSLYTDLIPSHLLAPMLWMEAGRMHNLAITPETLKERLDALRDERATTLTGYNQAILEVWPALVFANPQNSHSYISGDNIATATVEEVTKFYRTWYAPNNAVLVLAGDFQTPDAKKLVDQYFGPIPSQPPPQKPDLAEQLRPGKGQVFQDSHIGLPAVVVGWLAPERHSAAWYAMQMVDAVLTKGQTARIPANLVQGRQSILQFQSGIGFPFEDAPGSPNPAEYGILAYYRPGLRPELIVNEIQQEIEDMAIRGVNGELPRIKAALRVRRISQIQNAVERARVLGEYELLDGKLGMIDDDFLGMLAVSPGDVQQMARRGLTAARRDVLLIAPAPRTPPRAEPKSDSKTGK